MATTRSSGEYYEYATVDAHVESAEEGYFTNPVSMKNKKIKQMFFSIRETDAFPMSSASVITIHLQFRCTGDAGWQDYSNDGTAFAIGDRKLIEDTGGGVAWRAGVKGGADYTSGSLTFGFDW